MIADNELLYVLSSLDAELSARSAWLPNVDSLDFINDPAKDGPYQCKTPDQLIRPNVGLHALKSTPKNHIFLEHENRLCDILRTLESMDATEAREDMEDRVIQELIRINHLKEIEWSGQRSGHGIKGAVVNAGMLVSLLYVAAASDIRQYLRASLRRQTSKEHNYFCHLCDNTRDEYSISPSTSWRSRSTGRHEEYPEEPAIASPAG